MGTHQSIKDVPPMAASTSTRTGSTVRPKRSRARGSTVWLFGLALCACTVTATASPSEAYLRPCKFRRKGPTPATNTASATAKPYQSSYRKHRIHNTNLSSTLLRATINERDTEKDKKQKRVVSIHTPEDENLSEQSSVEFREPINGSSLLFFADRQQQRMIENGKIDPKKKNGETEPTTRSMWRRRNARSAEEGIRREKTSQLSTLLAKARSIETQGKQYAARTISGLINALAEEVNDLDVEVDARSDTPFSGKQVDAIRIKFSRLGFKPLQMGGLDRAVRQADEQFTDTDITKDLADLSCADEAFDRIDADHNGGLDSDEIALVLNLAAGGSTDEMDERKSTVLKDLASDLVQLYDFNGDGVVDRSEYQSMVEDMAALRKSQKKSQKAKEGKTPEIQEKKDSDAGWLSSVMQLARGMLFSQATDKQKEGDIDTVAVQRVAQKDDVLVDVVDGVLEVTTDTSEGIVDVSDSLQIIDTVSKSLGSITLSDLKIDLRRLLFGAVPILKHITPGGPLILEPFTTTVNGSFSREDMMNSFLLDAGLRRLVARALRRRVRSFRDLIDGAVFFGRSWNMASASAPVVEVPEVTDIEFDDDNRLIITGLARVQTRSDAPQIENAFKVRTRIGTRKGGRTIRLIEPELAFVLECPKSIENTIGTICKALGVKRPERPAPIYSFFPIYSPFKVDEDEGFDLGEDNRIRSIFVRNGALRFEMSAVLRPGRFLGNHYLAFTIPNRTFIITLDRVKEGMKAARKMKQAAKALEQAADRKDGWRHKVDMPTVNALPEHPIVTAPKNGKTAPSPNTKRVAPKNFFSRFVDGYLKAEREEENERFTTAISDWFGRQGSNTTTSDDDDFDDE